MLHEYITYVSVEAKHLNTTRELKFSQARDRILQWIREGRVPSGGKLPSERDLARQLSIDHRTVRRGLGELVSAGLVVKRPRVGNFVREIVAPEMLTQVAVVLPDYLLQGASKHPVTALIHQTVNRYLSHDHYSVTNLWYHRDRFWEDVGERILSRRIRGVLVYLSTTQSVASGLKRLTEAGVRVSCLDYRPFLDGLDVFTVDMRPNAALRELIEGLLARGHRRIVVALYTPWWLLDETKKMLQEYAVRYDLGDPDRMVLSIPSDGYHARNEVLDELLESPDRPTAIIVPDEFVVSYVFRRCYQRRIAVPRDLSIAALLDSAPHTHPIPVTAPDSFFLRASELATKHLEAMLKGQPLQESYVRLRNNIQWTESVADLTAEGHPLNPGKESSMH